MRINELVAIGIAILAVIFVVSPKATTTEFAGEVTGISFFAVEDQKVAAR